MSEEDKIVNALIEQLNEHAHSEFDIECPYNNYGDKGVVDVVATTYFEAQKMYSESFKSAYKWYMMPTGGNVPREFEMIAVIEVKSSYAVQEATGANEIIRQFRKHMEHFFEGSTYDASYYSFVTFWLIFEDTDEVRQHLDENYRMYNNLDGRVGVAEVSESGSGWDAKYLPRYSRADKPDWLNEYSEQEKIA